jgi:hypothetical protein
MAGGLLNLVSVGQQNIILNSSTHPAKTFWKCGYKKYTNFGLQRFRVDFEGSPTLKLNETSTFQFKIPRYGDLLADTFLNVNLPSIWSPIFPPQEYVDANGNSLFSNWTPYQFKWIENIGAQMISKIEIVMGNQKLQEFSGIYLLSLVLRDFPAEKVALFNEMIGNVPELIDPANAEGRTQMYPNAFYTDNPSGSEPSIKGRQLTIPLNAWFSLQSQMAFPLVSTQYNELYIYITFRPIQELFQIRDIFNHLENYPYVAPNFNQYYMQFYRFLQTPPDIDINIQSYTDQRSIWFPDIHLTCTYCFLSNEEQKVFAGNEKKYLFKQVHEQIFYNVTGANKVDLDSIGLVSSWMFYFQRSDVNLRNEWSNYSNWTYQNIPPQPVFLAPEQGDYFINGKQIGPGINPDGTITDLYITGIRTNENTKEILIDLAILCDGQYRENTLQNNVYHYIEKYTRTGGKAPSGLYCYQFCMHTSPFDLQPSGAMNMNRFNQIQFEFNTIIPPLDPYAQSLTICDPESGNIVGINKPTWRIYTYNYNLYLMEERINMVVFIGGNAGLLYAT